MFWQPEGVPTEIGCQITSLFDMFCDVIAESQHISGFGTDREATLYLGGGLNLCSVDLRQSMYESGATLRVIYWQAARQDIFLPDDFDPGSMYEKRPGWQEYVKHEEDVPF